MHSAYVCVFKWNDTTTSILPFFLGDKSAHLYLDSETTLVYSCLRKNQGIWVNLAKKKKKYESMHKIGNEHSLLRDG